ncbi:MAG: hypothetical protein WAS73_11615 [Defluviicoccus sp.]
MNFFHALLRPDREELEMADRMIMVSAANLLDVGEFQFLQLAYREWFGKDLPPPLVDRLFHRYMMDSEVPPWARHYARLILARADGGRLDPNDLAYHRYDHAYRTKVPKGVQSFVALVSVLAFFLVASVLIADLGVRSPLSRLPPYFEKEDFRKPAPTAAVEDGAQAPMTQESR